MIKTLLTLLLGLAILNVAHAQSSDSLIYYFKNSGRPVYEKDSADYYRVVRPPGVNDRKDRFRVDDYFANGKIKRMATSLNTSADLVLDGICTDYFPNGKIRITAKFKEGHPLDSVFCYYPNGKMYAILIAGNSGYSSEYMIHGYLPYTGYYYKFHIAELRDSTGNVRVKNGSGHAIFYYNDLKKIVMEGDIKDDKREGEWIGPIADSGRFILNYHKDELKSGTSYIYNGHKYTFKEIVVNPRFSDGEEAFLVYVKTNIQYPESAKKANLTETAEVRFYVETDGRVTDVRLEKGVLKSLDDEFVRVVAASPLWIPGTLFGIPVRARYAFRFNYNAPL